jgi:hypothetical protein
VLRLERPFLHAERLAFKHPRDQRRLEFSVPLPADLMGVLEDLPGWNDDELADSSTRNSQGLPGSDIHGQR